MRCRAGNVKRTCNGSRPGVSATRLLPTRYRPPLRSPTSRYCSPFRSSDDLEAAVFVRHDLLRRPNHADRGACDRVRWFPNRGRLRRSAATDARRIQTKRRTRSVRWGNPRPILRLTGSDFCVMTSTLARWIDRPVMATSTNRRSPHAGQTKASLVVRLHRRRTAKNEAGICRIGSLGRCPP